MTTNLFKVEYTTKNGKVFRTIANTDNVDSYMVNHYNMEGIAGYSFKPTKKTKYKGVVNKTVK